MNASIRITDAPLLSLDADQVRGALPFAKLIPALKQTFATGAQVPMRHHHKITQTSGAAGTLLIMPAWENSGYLGIKMASIFPNNAKQGLPSVYSTYLLCDASNGRPLALIEGNQITARRTAGVAALAASYLAKPQASSLLIVGAGRVAQLVATAFREVRPIRHVAVWNVNSGKAAALARDLRADGFDAGVADDLRSAAGRADIISCATLTTTPLIRGDWLKPGTHLDLIGSFRPDMQEADDMCFAKGRVFVDTIDALEECGDLISPLAKGLFARTDVGTLEGLCTGVLPGRENNHEITVFKAVGSALSDIAAGALAYRSARLQA